MTDNQKNWDNYWQGRTAERAGSALVGVENNSEIKSFWSSKFEKLPKTIKVLDLACGAGTVAGILAELAFEDIAGADISEAAITVLKDKLPEVKGVVAPSEDLPFDDHTFDLIVSQFGFEYGEYKQVVPEVARALTSEGEFLALSHKAGGVIHKEVLTKLDEMKRLKASGLADVTRDLFTASFSSQGRDEIKAVAVKFRSVRMDVEPLASDPNGFARYFVNGIQDLFQRKAALGLDEMLGWLDNMEMEMNRFIGRMESMDKAALDEKGLAMIESQFISLDVQPADRNVLKDGQGNELGWIISALKQ